MSKTSIGRPASSEFAENYSDYIGKVPGDDILKFLEEQLVSTVALLRGIDEEKGNFRYAAGKWSVKELVGHVIDMERVFAYRALSFARNDTAPIPGVDQDPWAQHANHANVPLADLAAEFESVRRATIYLFRHLDAAAWDRSGTANNTPMTTRAAAYGLAGHAQHHLEILKSRYL